MTYDLDYERKRLRWVVQHGALEEALHGWSDALDEIDRIQYLLSTELTPGGSEFARNPDNCVRWAKQYAHDTERIAINQSARRNALEEEKVKLVQTINGLKTFVEDREAKLKEVRRGNEDTNAHLAHLKTVLCLTIDATFPEGVLKILESKIGEDYASDSSDLACTVRMARRLRTAILELIEKG